MATSCSESNSEYSEYTDSNLDLRMKELKEFQSQNVYCQPTCSVLEGTDLRTASNRFRLVKAYAQIKEEMEKSTAKTIADHLYQHREKLLSAKAHESIHSAKTRPDTVEMLLKKVLMGSDVAYEVFINVLRQNEEFFADLLDSITPSEEDLQAFLKMEKKAECLKPRQGKSKPNKKYMKRHRSKLMHWLNDRDVVDSINDQFLSRLIFRIDEHSVIADSTNDTMKKLRLLLRTMENCQQEIRNAFLEVLQSDTVRMKHVVERLQNKRITEPCRNEKRKQTSDDLCSSTPTKSKRQNLSSDKEADIVKAIQNSNGANFKGQLSKLDLEYEGSKEGSIIIQMIPKSKMALQKLKNSCRTGKINDIVPDVFMNNVSDMEEGEYLLTFKVFLLPTPPYSSDDKKVIFHLEMEESESIDIVDNSKLLCRDLEITDKLLVILQREGIVGGDIKQEISKLPRRKKIQHVLDKISMHGRRGYTLLKEYIETVDKNLYNELIIREDASKINKDMRIGTLASDRPLSASSDNRKELLYTASLLLAVKKILEKR